MSGRGPGVHGANITARQRWDQGHAIHNVHGAPGPSREMGPVIRQVVLAPSEIKAKQWAQAARDAGFDVKTSAWGDDGLWCYERA